MYLVGAVAQFDIANRYSACNSTTSPCDAPEIRYTYPAPPTNKASLPQLYASDFPLFQWNAVPVEIMCIEMDLYIFIAMILLILGKIWIKILLQQNKWEKV